MTHYPIGSSDGLRLIHIFGPKLSHAQHRLLTLLIERPSYDRFAADFDYLAKTGNLTEIEVRDAVCCLSERVRLDIGLTGTGVEWRF